MLQENPYPGIFIAFEGIDGSGKTTQAAKLEYWLKSVNDRVHRTKEPTQYSERVPKLRPVLSGEIQVSPMTLQKWFIADRDHHLHYEIIPELGRGQTVICDRYFLSTLAYGSLAGKRVLERLLKLHVTIPHFVLPDLTFVIDLDAKEAVQRQKAIHHELDIFEKEATLAKVRSAYHLLARRFDNVFVVNGERPADEIFEDIKRHVRQLMERRREFLFPKELERTGNIPRLTNS